MKALPRVARRPAAVAALGCALSLIAARAAADAPRAPAGPTPGTAPVSTPANAPATATPTSPAPTPARPAEVPLAEALQGEARQAFEAANLLIANRDFAGAAIKLGQAYELSKDPRLLFNMAVCEKDLHHYARMKTLLEQYEREAGANLSPEAREQVEGALRAIHDLVGAVRISTPVEGAIVSIDDATAGATPLAAPIPLDLGPHKLAVRKEGFRPFETALEITGGSEVALDVNLVKPGQVARLSVTTDGGAVVAVDDQPQVAGHFEASLAPGPHRVRVSESGKLPYTAEIELHDGENRTLQITLESAKKGAPIWPWIVGGAAVVVAGASLGGYFAFHSGSSAPGAPPAAPLGTVQFLTFGR